MKLQLSFVIIAVNCAAALAIGICFLAFAYLEEIARRSFTPANNPAVAPGNERRGDPPLGIDKTILMDREKSAAKIQSMQNMLKDHLNNPRIYTRLPEAEFFKSLIGYYFLSRILSATTVTLDQDIINNFKSKGMILYSMDKTYPLMKKSIYIDKKRKTASKPIIRPGTNIIFIFGESFSQFFLRDDVHGVKGLTTHFKDMERDSLLFTNMYNAAFPTIRGLIASLGSGTYLLDENIGCTRIPIPCRFLFLSDILKKLNYTNIHIQAGSERFIGMKNFFIKRQSYDYFYGSESLALKNFGSFKNGFGVDDDTLFDFIVDWLKKYQDTRPFLLTVSTINSHPPFKVRQRLAAAGDNDLLNALYSTDIAFGKFWDYFKNSRHRDNTLVILTADHAMGNNNEYIRFMKNHEQYFRPFFDSFPCSFFFPGAASRGMRKA